MIESVKNIGIWILIGMFLFHPVQGYPQGQGEIAVQYSSLKNQGSRISPITIGHIVPPIVFRNVLNYSTKNLELSKLKGKLVILDFWSTYCGVCIGGFPKMEELQKAFNDRIQILLVNSNTPKYDSEKKIKSVLETMRLRTGFYPSMPIPIHDTILNNYFPHESVPHQVWIDGNGKLVAVTGYREVTYENIKSILEGENINLPVKNDWVFDREKPLYIDGNGGDGQNIKFRSIFSGYNGSLGSIQGGRWNDKGEVTGFFCLNKSLIRMVRLAYMDLFNEFDKSREILEVQSPEKFNDEFTPGNTYCYDIIIPPTTSKNFDYKEYLKDDLKRVFGIIVRLEKRKVKCYVIRASAEISNLFTKEGWEEIELGRKSVKKFICNYSIGAAIRSIQEHVKIPLIDETKMSEQRIDLNFPENFNLSNSKALIDFLEKNGFRIESTERLLDVLVISDRTK